MKQIEQFLEKAKLVEDINGQSRQALRKVTCLALRLRMVKMTGHVRLVDGEQSLPIGAPLIVDAIFEIEPLRHSTSKQHRYCENKPTPQPVGRHADRPDSSHGWFGSFLHSIRQRSSQKIMG